MDWLRSIDTALFRFFNQSLANPVFDTLMPWLSGNRLFLPACVLLAIGLIWRGGLRGRLCALMLFLLVLVANNLLMDVLKDLFGRPRPFLALDDVRLLVGKGGSFSMPSSHAANWFCALAVAWTYYRRSARVLFPLAFLVAFSRVYNGVHYPADVLVGALAGTAIGAGGLWLAEKLWTTLVRSYFPLWWRHMPSLTRPEWRPDALMPLAGERRILHPEHESEQQWLRLGYTVIGGLLLLRLIYLASGTIELSKDEAYQWLWSKHLALSYFSKPPMIAYIQFLGTSLWGDTEFGIRFFSPIITALISLVVLRFFAREVNARTGFFMLVIMTATPILSLGSILMTVDPPLVLFWVAAMITGWRAVQPHGRTRDWVWTGVWLGFGFLSKYTALAQWASFLIFLACRRSARPQLLKPGVYLALLINVLFMVPVIVWNAQHDWVTIAHLKDRAGLAEEGWQLTSRYFWDFLFTQMALLNPVFFIGMIWAIVQVLRKRRNHALLMYLFCMGAPLYFGYWLYTARVRVLPNWVAPAVPGLFCLMVIYAESRWQAIGHRLRPWLRFGVALGLVGITLAHESNWIGKLIGRPLPPRKDPLRRVRYWSDLARIVEREREVLEGEGKPVFLIGDHYGTTSLMTFYIPAAKSGVPGHPLVFCPSADVPDNQFYFWPGYEDRKGQNAIYLAEENEPKPPPAILTEQFESVTSLGMRETTDRGRVMRRVELFACRGLR